MLLLEADVIWPVLGWHASQLAAQPMSTWHLTLEPSAHTDDLLQPQDQEGY